MATIDLGLNLKCPSKSLLHTNIHNTELFWMFKVVCGSVSMSMCVQTCACEKVCVSCEVNEPTDQDIMDSRANPTA